MKRTTAVAAVVGLATGLGLGITGIAGAVGGTPSPGAAAGEDRPHPRHDKLAKHRHRGGVVTAVTPTSLTVATPRGSRTVVLDGSTRYFVGKQAATWSALRVGEVVGFTLVDPSAATAVAKHVVVLPAHIRGLVTAIDGTTLTVVDSDGFTRTIRTTGAVSVKKGQFVVAVGTVDAGGTTLDATSVRPLKRAPHKD